MDDPASKVPVKVEKTGPAVKEAAGLWAPLDTLRHEVDRLFENFLGPSRRFPFGRSPLDFELAWPRIGELAIAPSVDIAAKDNEFEITAELPGLEEKDIEVSLANGALTIKGEKKEEKEEKGKDYYLSERRYGSFARSFAVPEGVDIDKIEETFSKGVLTIKMPKTAEAQKNEKKIEVKAG
ncbi:MAG: Hsp20/alpha crystallin family protein [Rhodoblastus sp.]|uniref:Hsp20/alpha crystallin family protein n=1 Tax=Rhodoblastus sp. TaxID=1962975 RepID=UPI003F99BB5A